MTPGIGFETHEARVVIEGLGGPNGNSVGWDLANPNDENVGQSGTVLIRCWLPKRGCSSFGNENVGAPKGRCVQLQQSSLHADGFKNSSLAVTLKQNLLGDVLISSALNKDLTAMKFVLEEGWGSKKGSGGGYDLVQRWKFKSQGDLDCNTCCFAGD